MKHDEVVAALKVIAVSPKAPGIDKDAIQELKGYNLIALAEPGEAGKKNPAYALTKKGRVMHKANSKDLKETKENEQE